MRIQFKQKNRVIVIDAIQMLRFNNDNVGLILPYSKRLENKNYDTYESTTPADEADFNRWCEQLLRTGYLDLTRTDLEFKATYSTPIK